jgi:hypothetical protein
MTSLSWRNEEVKAVVCVEGTKEDLVMKTVFW